MRRLLILLILYCSTALGADGIQSGKSFKLPFACDNQPAINRAVVQGDILTVHYVKGGEILTVAYKLVPQVNPDPGPGPIPPVPPVPVPTPTAFYGVVIEEQSARTAEQGIVLGSQKVREAFGAGNFRVEDKDVKDKAGQVPVELAPYLTRAKDKTLPYLMVIDKGTGKAYWEGPLPATVDALLKVLGKGGAK